VRSAARNENDVLAVLGDFMSTRYWRKTVYYLPSARTYLTDDEYVGLQGFMLKYPEAGDIVPGSGGVRKLRWAMTGKGKSGGVRMIYYFKKRDDEIWMLTIYSKRQVGNIPAHILRQIAKEIKDA
jgi:hypothetical protein